MLCWGVTDGSAGTMAQVKALAAALGYEPVMKTVKIKAPLIWFPNVIVSKLARIIPRTMQSHDSLTPPWPEVIISCGRRGALASLGLRAMGATSKCIHIHDPQMDPKNFDLIIAMEHDKIEGKNVIKTKFALHAITQEVLDEAAKKFAKRFTLYPKPYTAVLLGGSTNKYTLSKKSMGKMIDALKQVIVNGDSTLLITTSRRTGGENLKRLLDAFPRAREARAYVYDGVSENPYLGMLALADHIIVTDDSVNMMSEAVATGKPVYILKLPGHKNTKPARFADKLIAEGVARPLEGKLEKWDYAAGDEIGKVTAAAAVKSRLG